MAFRFTFSLVACPSVICGSSCIRSNAGWEGFCLDAEFRRYRANVAAKYLERVRGMGMRVKSIKYAIEDLRLSASGVSGLDYSKGNVATSPSADAIPNALDTIDSLISELACKREAYENELAIVIRAINRMENQRSAAIIEMHYISNKTWRECAEVFHYSKRWMMNARQIALSEFYEVMPPIEIEEIPTAI